MAYSYRCKDYPERQSCPGLFEAETEAELWKHIEIHASVAHQEDPRWWSAHDRHTMTKCIGIILS
ncbi:MAG: DUF1059 domain-containing protein [Rhizobiales bacterium]|nr:DUF1059 domain-containing protein [Hyphomicrobiales bacterium]